MGAWGPGIFDDDLALDVREEYLELLAAGHSVTDCSKRVIERRANELRDPDEAPVVWLALAATQWEYGAFGQGVLDAALIALQRDEALCGWETSEHVARRRGILARLLKKLQSAPPKLRRPRRRKLLPPRPSHSVDSPDGRATITAYELSGDVSIRERTQVLCEIHGVGGGHVALFSCSWEEISFRWVDVDTAQISYPTGTLLELPEPTVHNPKLSVFYAGRTVSITYLETVSKPSVRAS
jgi:hypothetical protein